MAKAIISMPEDLFKQIDEHCEKYNYTRSEFIRQASREKIKNDREK